MATSIHPNNSENFAKLKCPPSTIICREKTTILGSITIGPDCVVHPTASIIARAGPIIIGGNNLIEERAKIINNRAEPLIIGDHNVFEVDSHCEAVKIGNNNLLECSGCQIVCEDQPDSSQLIETLAPNTVISGLNMNRRIVPELPTSSHTSQLDFLRKILPNYQKLWRPANIPQTPPQR